MIRLRNGNTLFEEIMESYNLRSDDEFEFEKFGGTYRFHKNDDNAIVLQVLNAGKWIESHLDVNLMVTLNIKVKPFMPKYDEKYWHLHITDDLCLVARETTFKPYCCSADYVRAAQGNCFRSRNEIGNLYDRFTDLYGQTFDEFKEKMRNADTKGLTV